MTPETPDPPPVSPDPWKAVRAFAPVSPTGMQFPRLYDADAVDAARAADALRHQTEIADLSAQVEDAELRYRVTYTSLCDQAAQAVALRAALSTAEDTPRMAERTDRQEMTMQRISEIEARHQRASQGQWAAFRMTHDERGDDLTPDELGEYVKNSVVKSAGESGSSAFLFVSVQKPDGGADVCHVGNGPTSPANADFIAHAHDDVPFLLALLRERDAQIASLTAQVEQQTQAFEDECGRHEQTLIGKRGFAVLVAQLGAERDAAQQEIAEQQRDYAILSKMMARETEMLRDEEQENTTLRETLQAAWCELIQHDDQPWVKTLAGQVRVVGLFAFPRPQESQP